MTGGPGWQWEKERKKRGKGRGGWWAVAGLECSARVREAKLGLAQLARAGRPFLFF